MNEKIVVFTVRSQKAPGEKVFRLHKPRIVLGSATSSDLKLEDPQVSPVHAILEVSGIDGKPVIYDLASESGVLVNGVPSVQSSLGGDDKVTIGPFVISIRVQTLNELPKAPPQLVRESFGQKLFVSEREDLAPLLLEDEADVVDVFNREPESRTSLQVVMFYGDTILNVEHFVDQRKIVIGPGAKEDFSIPPFFGSGKLGRFDLVTNDAGRYYLHLHDQMDGVISQNGRMTAVKELMAGMATAQSKIYPLVDKDFAKVKLKDVSFFLNFTPAPPKLRKLQRPERDPFFTKVWMASLAFTVALLLGVSNLKVNPTIEIEQLPERVATIIYESKMPVERPPVVRREPKPEPEPEPKPEPKPEPEKIVEKKPEPPKIVKIEPKVAPKTPAPKKAMIVEKKAETESKTKTKTVAVKEQPRPAVPKKAPAPAKHASGQEGAGMRAKGLEGMRGAPNAPKAAIPQNKALRPGEGKPTKVASSGKGRSETDDLGMVDVFKAQKGTLSKILQGGFGVQNAANRLEGYSGFTTEGKGGLGAAGTGKGGGGQSMGIGGLSDHGIGGGRHGKGLGALGSGGNILGGTGRLTIDSGGGSSEPIVLGAIDTDAIAREIAKHRDEIKYCYEKEINAERPDLAGRVGVRFVIGASGAVTSAGISSTSLRNTNTERCVIEVIRRIQFPPVRGGGIAEVTYPFLFKPSNK